MLSNRIKNITSNYMQYLRFDFVDVKKFIHHEFCEISTPVTPLVTKTQNNRIPSNCSNLEAQGTTRKPVKLNERIEIPLSHIFSVVLVSKA